MPLAPSTATVPENFVQNKSTLIPLILVTSLFFLWGIANILNSALIAHFQPVFDISRTKALLVETAFYLGYFTIALPAGFFIQRYNYKTGILFGLFLYSAGALLFIPAAELLTFGFFLIALYVIASGLAFIETAANPYITILGNPATSVQRLNFSQSFNGLALVVGPWIAGQFIFAGNEGPMDLLEHKQQAADAVVMPYTILAAVVFFIAVLFYFARMPEPPKGKPIRFDKQIFADKNFTYAIIAQFFYVGAQASIWGITINYVTEMLPGTSKEFASKHFMVIGTVLFVTGRFLGTWMMTFIKDYKILTYYGVAASLLCVIGIFGDGLIAVYSVVGLNLFMSIMFPTIFALGVRNLGEHTKLGSSFIIMAIVGGAILPPVMGSIADNVGIQQAFFIPLVCFLFVMWYGFHSHKIPSEISK